MIALEKLGDQQSYYNLFWEEHEYLNQISW